MNFFFILKQRKTLTTFYNLQTRIYFKNNRDTNNGIQRFWKKAHSECNVWHVSLVIKKKYVYLAQNTSLEEDNSNCINAMCQTTTVHSELLKYKCAKEFGNIRTEYFAI